jgi:hypothetical protein
MTLRYSTPLQGVFAFAHANRFAGGKHASETPATPIRTPPFLGSSSARSLYLIRGSLEPIRDLFAAGQSDFVDWGDEKSLPKRYKPRVVFED